MLLNKPVLLACGVISSRMVENEDKKEAPVINFAFSSVPWMRASL
jgi:hypothetical protein